MNIFWKIEMRNPISMFSNLNSIFGARDKMIIKNIFHAKLFLVSLGIIMAFVSLFIERKDNNLSKIGFQIIRSNILNQSRSRKQ